MSGIVKGIGKYVYDNAEMLAKMAVEETGIGVVEDKILKNKGKARVIWNNLKADGSPNPMSLHAARPVESGVKYVVTKWFRERRWVH